METEKADFDVWVLIPESGDFFRSTVYLDPLALAGAALPAGAYLCKGVMTLDLPVKILADAV